MLRVSWSETQEWGEESPPPPPEKLQSGWFVGITLSHSCNNQPQCWGPPSLYFTSWVKRGLQGPGAQATPTELWSHSAPCLPPR